MYAVHLRPLIFNVAVGLQLHCNIVAVNDTSVSLKWNNLSDLTTPDYKVNFESIYDKILKPLVGYYYYWLCKIEEVQH